jgi:hypothetical protein
MKKTELENDDSKLTDEKFQKAVHAVYKKIQVFFKPASASQTLNSAAAIPTKTEPPGAQLVDAKVKQNPVAMNSYSSVVPNNNGIQGFQLLLRSKQSVIDSSKSMSDLIAFHDSKQGFNLRTTALYEETKRHLPTEAARSQPMVYTVGSITSPHAPQSPYGFIASPGMPSSTIIQNASNIRANSTSQVTMVSTQPINGGISSPASANIGKSTPTVQTIPSVDPTVSDGYAVGQVKPQRSPLSNLTPNGNVIYNRNPDRPTLQQEFLKIKELELLSIIQVPGQNTRWSLYSFDIRRMLISFAFDSMLIYI